MDSLSFNGAELLAYAILGIVVVIILTKKLFLCTLIANYQEEKPKEEKGPFDAVFNSFLSALYVPCVYSGYCQLFALFIPPELTSFDFAYIISFIEYFIGQNLIITTLITLYIKFVFIFAPEVVADIRKKHLSAKSRLWKWVILICVTVLDHVYPFDSSPITFKLFTGGKEWSSPICKHGIGHLLLFIVFIIFGVYFLKSLFSLQHAENERVQDLKKHSPIISAIIVIIPLFYIFLALSNLNSDVLTLHLLSLLYQIFFWILPLRYYINQNENLKLYHQVYLHYPPKVLPWQLPKNWQEKFPNIQLDIAGE